MTKLLKVVAVALIALNLFSAIVEAKLVSTIVKNVVSPAPANQNNYLLSVADIAKCFTETTLSNSNNDPDIKRNITELITAQGYRVEEHKVTTADGYILTLFRIPNGKNENGTSSGKKAVLLNHGLMGSCAQWVIQKGDKNLAMKLADAGYDVWLNNHRGTSHSTGHVNLTQNDVEYWDFSWHEMGVYDVPAIIDYMLNATHNSKIFYVGHSQGTTQLFVTLSELEQYNSKIEVAFLLAPVAYLSHAKNNFLKPLGYLAYNNQYLFDTALGGKLQLNALTKYLNTSIGQICAVSQLTCPLCANVVTALFGYDGPQIDYPRLDVMLSKFPDSASTKCFVHYAQTASYSPASFRQFDYGTSENENRYGTAEPPAYNLSNVVTKIIAFYGDSDDLANPTDVPITYSKLGNQGGNELIRVNWTLFHHLDFAFAKDADYYVYDHILEVMNG